ncbi:MAG: hypothetical protein HQL63_13775 [Magnetococcales bacterium]|nr:hypothetical protein [Magnetococcales bacterium]
MLTITVQCKVPWERTITVKLPDQVKPGTHNVVLMFDRIATRRASSGDAESLMK